MMRVGVLVLFGSLLLAAGALGGSDEEAAAEYIKQMTKPAVAFISGRTAPPGKKITLTFDLIQTTRLLVLAGLRRRFPTASEVELRRQLICRLLPREDVIRAYGFDPKAEGH